MRLWSLHPKYYDDFALARCYYEGLGGLKAMLGLRVMHKNHPQLIRFKQSDNPEFYLKQYLRHVYREVYNRKKDYEVAFELDAKPTASKIISVTSGQVEFERQHLLNKIKGRNKSGKSDKYIQMLEDGNCELHPIFYLVDGSTESWEKC